MTRRIAKDAFSNRWPVYENESLTGTTIVSLCSKVTLGPPLQGNTSLLEILSRVLIGPHVREMEQLNRPVKTPEIPLCLKDDVPQPLGDQRLR